MNNEPKIILYADDDSDDQELLQEAFIAIDAHAEVRTASNGKEVVDLLHSLPDEELPCIIVLDYNMPEMNGAEVLDAICNSNRYKNIPKIIWSTSGDAHYKEICKEKGADYYFQKPHSYPEVVSMAEQMLSFCKDVNSFSAFKD